MSNAVFSDCRSARYNQTHPPWPFRRLWLHSGCAANAFANLVGHARRGNVKWHCASIYSVAGIVGAFNGSSIGGIVDGHNAHPIGIVDADRGVLMVRKSGSEGNLGAQCSRENIHKVGFFGIGGGFLIVPGLIAAIFTGGGVIGAYLAWYLSARKGMLNNLCDPDIRRCRLHALSQPGSGAVSREVNVSPQMSTMQ